MLDVYKINSGNLGIVNLNNMIPVNMEDVILLELQITETDTQQQLQYKLLVIEQLRILKQNEKQLLRKAKVLYQMITQNKAKNELAKRCCDFKKLERALEKYSNR